MFSSNSDEWRKLDNAAKIFPATRNRQDPRVFRFYCECKEQVDGDTLQLALEKTIQKFPLFLSVLRKGLFWFYLEQSSLVPKVQPEHTPPCQNLYLGDRKTLLFQVTYYQNRINFEVFHALTDGTGASLFLQELVKQYLILRYPEAALPDYPLTTPDITAADMETDGFSKYYQLDTGKAKPTIQKRKSYQLGGPRNTDGGLSLAEGVVSCKELLSKAKEYGVSMTVFLSAVLLCAIHEEMSAGQRKKPIALMVPVNLRKHFPSASMLNFFGWIEPAYRFQEESVTFEEVVKAVDAYFQEELTKESLGYRFSKLMQLERNPILRFFPLELKNLGMLLGASFAKKDVTAIFSNLGVIRFPEEYTPYLQRFGVFTSTPKLELSICSYQDDLVLSFASAFRSQNIERNFFRILKSFGISIDLLQEQFPQAEPVRRKTQPMQWITFICIAAIVIVFMVSGMFTPMLHWPRYAAGGIVSAWLVSATALVKRHNLLKNGVWQMLLIPLLGILWDIATGWHGWSLDFLMPAVYLVIPCTMMIVTRVRHLPVASYMIYYIMMALLGLLPTILLLFRHAHFPLLCILCGGISFLWLTALLLFKGQDFWSELGKKLHF